MEFSSLTPIGEASLKANFYEFIAIWEHQKIKMISQAPIIKINELNNLHVSNPELFSISFTPYLDILTCMKARGSIAVNEFKYIVSRKNNIFSARDWFTNLNGFIEKIDLFEQKINLLGRKRDLKDEDSRKELLKYLLGIRDDLTFDQNSNPIGCCCKSDFNGEFCITDNNKFDSILKLYIKLNKYKIKKYKDLFVDSESEIRRQYCLNIKDIDYTIDKSAKINWDFYNIKIDKVIMSSLSIFIACSMLSLEFWNIKNENLRKLFDFMLLAFPSIVKTLDLKTFESFKRWFGQLYSSLMSEEFDQINEQFEYYDTAEMIKESSSSLLKKIKAISRDSVIFEQFDRKRYMNLINLIKNYYYQNFLKDGKLYCECCGQEMFIKDDNLPYTEFHHIIPFKKAFGPDHYLNLVVLCPNCHRKFHFIKSIQKKQLYEMLDQNNRFNKTIIDRLMQLKSDKILKSYHLEFLLSEGAITEKQYNQIIQ